MFMPTKRYTQRAGILCSALIVLLGMSSGSVWAQKHPKAKHSEQTQSASEPSKTKHSKQVQPTQEPPKAAQSEQAQLEQKPKPEPELYIPSPNQVMVDKVVAVVGNSMILYSDLIQASKSLIEQRRSQGYTSDRDPMCEALETLIEQKILYTQSQIDSLTIDNADIALMVENALEQEIAQRGSQAAVEMYYHKPIFDIRSDLQSRYEEVRYAMMMKQTVNSKSTITSGEVEYYFKRMPKDSIPIIPEQYVFSQIVRYPPSTEEAKFRTRERILELRERIMNGTKFEMLARMYSEDPATAVRGGEMDPMPKESFVQPFADALVKLRPGQVSEAVETEFGFHLIQLIDQNGNLYHCRHILLKPQFTDDEIRASFKTLDSLKSEIQKGNITFKDAVEKYSEDKYSNKNGGVATNIELLAMTNRNDAKAATTKFLKEELSQMPEVYNALRKMKPGDISDAFASQDSRGNIMGKMVRLDEIIPTHKANLAEDFLRIQELALTRKQADDYEKWLKGKASSMYIRVDPQFKTCEFQRPYLLK